MKERIPSAAEAVPGILSTSSTSQAPSSAEHHPYAGKKHIGENVMRLLSWREVSPTVRRPLSCLWGQSARWSSSSSARRHEATSAKLALSTWLEAESLRHCTAKYCPLQPAPRSTIASAFSPDGTILASTHGDHTVKIVCCRTGVCLKTLYGHRRTPWVVRFHPSRSDILASGSLDNEVKLWDANTAECIASHDFYRPIASIAFHAQGDLLAVASGHKLYIWQYDRQKEATSPAIVLKTRRSLRAVQFHPHAIPLLMTAEVNGLDAPDCPMTLATSPGYLQYPRPAIIYNPGQQPLPSSRQSGSVPVANSQPYLPASWFLPASWVSDNDMGAVQSENMMVELNDALHVSLSEAENMSVAVDSEAPGLVGTSCEAAPMDVSPRRAQNDLSSTVVANMTDMAERNENFESGVDMLLRAAEGQTSGDEPGIVGGESGFSSLPQLLPSSETGNSLLGVNLGLNPPERQMYAADTWPGSGIWSVSLSSLNVQVLVGDSMQPLFQQPSPIADQSNWEMPYFQGWVMGESQQAGLGQQILHPSGGTQPGMLVVPRIPSGARGFQPPQQQQQHHRSTRPSFPSAAITSGNSELPCTVKLRIWPHDVKHPSAVLDPETCRLTIPHAVLCSEMGAHFSPCGRFLAACVACVLPSLDSDASAHSRASLIDTLGAGSLSTSPTRHPVSAQQVIYELRIYSLEEATFGQVLASRAIRAAHCLTSIQFSPTSGHILLAYGRRHNSLLRSIVVNGTAPIPIFTILEVYRVSDMELVKVLPSSEDEVNVACFHPIVGGGLAYGTKEGRLRIFQHDRSMKPSGSSRIFEDHVFEVG